MRKIALLATCLIVATAVNAQTLNVAIGNVTYSFPAEQMGAAQVSGGNTVIIMGRSFADTELTNLYVDNSEVTDNTVTVSYVGDHAKVVIAGNVAAYVNATVEGAKVSIEQSTNVDETTCGEITYILSGESSDGAFYMTGSYKSTVKLNGISLTNPNGAALEIKNGKRIKVKIADSNTITDGAAGSQKGCLSCTGHIEFGGSGVLNVYGNKSHAIYAKEYITVKKATINVLSSVKDGINCNQYFTLESGSLQLESIGDDGIQVSFKDDTDREAEDTGSFTIEDGEITVTTTAIAAKAIKCDGNMSLLGGKITAKVTGGGKWDADDLKTKASTCLSADGDVAINGTELHLSATGSGGKGISCDGSLTINSGKIDIATTGGMFAYVNGTTYDNYTGNTDRLDSDQKSSPKGIKADGNIDINGGDITVSTKGNGGEGIESKSVFTMTNGTVVANTRDDAINSSSHMYIKGGDITVVATNNDGLDSNGNLYIQGGTIRAFGAKAPECGLDANEEEGYTVIFTGGTVLAVGGGNSVPSTQESTQAYVSTSLSVTAGNTVKLTNGSTTLAEFIVPDTYTSTSGGRNALIGPGGGGMGGSSLLITCPALVSGQSYTISNGTKTSTVTATLTGNSRH